MSSVGFSKDVEPMHHNAVKVVLKSDVSVRII
jgi:hypothetical protein